MCVSAIPRDSLLFAPSLQVTVNIPQRKGNITTFGTDYWWTTSCGSGHGGGGGGVVCTSGRGVFTLGDRRSGLAGSCGHFWSEEPSKFMIVSKTGCLGLCTVLPKEGNLVG